MNMQPQIAHAAKRAATQATKRVKLDRLYCILVEAAEAGERCPTNEQLSYDLGYSSINKSAALIRELEGKGWITARKTSGGMVVTITETGKSTAEVISPHSTSDWTHDQQETLMELLSQGVSFLQAGKAIGRTKGSCISRFRKLARQLGEVV